MARGGARAGAGRPKAARNKRTVEQEEAIKASGLTPLAFLTSVYQNAGEDIDRRIDAAKAAAPYCHSRLSTIEMSGKDGEPIELAQEIRLTGVSSGHG